MITHTTDKENALIRAIAQRAAADMQWDVQTVEMDLTAAHANGCALNLGKLLRAESDDFGHDIAGINNHINRETGEVMNHFLPRCTLPDRKTDEHALDAMKDLEQVTDGLRKQVAEYTDLLENLSATGIWVPAAQAELVELQPYFVRLPANPDCVMVSKWTAIGWDADSEPNTTDTLEVLIP